MLELGVALLNLILLLSFLILLFDNNSSIGTS